MCWSLSPSSYCLKEREREKAWAIEKKCGHMKVQVLKKKEKNIWTHEGPWKKRKKKDSHALKKNLYRERDHTKGVFIPSTTIHTRAHLDLIVWLVFLFGSVFDFAIYMIQVCLILHALPWAPHIAITRSRMKKRQVKCHGEDRYTLSDLRESNEELSKVYFENLLKNPKLLDMRSRSDLIQDHSIPQLPKMAW